MRFRKLLIWSAVVIALLVGGGVLVGLALLPKDFEFSNAWLELRRQNIDLASSVKTVIIQSDQDVASIGETRQLPIINLKFSRQDIAHFVDLYEKYEDPNYGIPYYSKHNLWRNVEVEFEGRQIAAKVKSHGRSPTNHRNGKYISLAVKLERGENIRGSRRFSLLVRDHFTPKKQVVFDLADEFGVIKNQEELVRVKINHWDEKLFFLDRRLTDSFMEVEGRPSFRLFGYSRSAGATDKSSVYCGGEFDPVAYRERFLKTLAELEYPESHHTALADRFVAFNQALADGKYEELSEFCDIDYLASFQAMRLVSCLVGHLARFDNLYVFLDTANGKFYPVVTRDAWMSKMQAIEDGSPELVVDRVGPWDQPFFHAISRNEEVRSLAYQKIYAYMREHGETAGEKHRLIKERFEKLSYMGWATVGLRRAGMLEDDFTTHNLELLEYFMTTCKPRLELTVDVDKVLLEFRPWSMSPLTLDRLTVSVNKPEPSKEVPVLFQLSTVLKDEVKFYPPVRKVAPVRAGRIDLSELVNDIEFMTPIMEDSLRHFRLYRILMSLESDEYQLSTGPVQIDLYNKVTGVKIEQAEAKANFTAFDVTGFSGSAFQPGTPAWLAEHPQLRVERSEGRVAILPGEYDVTHDLVLPEGIKLEIRAGTKLRLGENVLITGTNGIDVVGTEEEPVEISAMDPLKPFGSVGFLGNRRATSTIQHLNIHHGFERWHKGCYFSGALSIHYNGKVDIRDTVVTNNAADDGLNVKYCDDVTLNGCTFKDNAADQVDLDLCAGMVSGCRFVIEARQDANGDGLDVSGSKMTVQECLFVGLPDKGMSVGEASQVLCRNNVFKSCTAGVAVKDSSHAWFVGNDFMANTVDVDAYQKKTIFDGGTVYFRDERGTSSFLDAKSRAFVATRPSVFDQNVTSGLDVVASKPRDWEPRDWRSLSATMDTPSWRPVEPDATGPPEEQSVGKP